jgi:hypothetical protein
MSIEIGTGADSLADDLLRGAEAIGDFINEPVRRVFYLAERKLLPIGRLGGGLIASKAALRQRYDQLTRGAADPPRQPPVPISERRRSARPPPLRRNRHRPKNADGVVDSPAAEAR